MDRRAFLRGAAAVGVGVAAGGPALGQSFPSNLIRIIVPYSAGGGTDIVARVIASKLQESLGQSVIVEYSTDLLTWTPTNGGAPLDSGVTGSFYTTITAPGDQTVLWNTRMLFRGRTPD